MKKNLDQPFLESASKNDVNWEVREAATARLNNKELLKEISISDKNIYVRQCALARLKILK